MSKPLWIVAWSINHGKNNIEDFWVIAESKQDAKESTDKLQELENVHCWAAAPIHDGSEPQYLDGGE